MCPHDKTRLRKDAGWDIGKDSEERQHIEICLHCGMERLVCDVIYFDPDIPPKKTKDEWSPKGTWSGFA